MAAITKAEFSNYIKQFKFRELFNDMGWDNDRTTQPVVVDTTTFQLQAVAIKSGFKILLCNAEANGLLPDYNTRKKIETKVTKLFQEHLLIFSDAKKQEQIWQLVVRQSGKPTKVTETRYHISQDPELLYQRASGLFFELDEEEHITIVDVTKRVADNFHQNNERVTKQFYDKFKQRHTAFLKFIKGFDNNVNKEWYASLMLNRLMFCYFIQKKGFLDNNKNYLSDKLQRCKDKKGKNKFYSFYRNFLLSLFHHGLGAPDHSKELKEEIGKIPYLNGGLFDVHELEKNHVEIEIDDKAFESIFNFFNEWEWHLDTRHTASGKDINPDVIGYIFEKYINDRADMGAYYTKEDITDYISKNCILPFLFDETKRQQPKAFSADAELWQMVKHSGDEYIYAAVKHGIMISAPSPLERAGVRPLPAAIEQGIRDVSKRTEWNKPAPPEFALPTEIWREVVDRRNRYTEVKTNIESGAVNSINDFITYNLNIRQFAIDCIANTTDPDFLRAFYKSLISVTIIDPTCGSGAFLFAAMNILEELYETCLQRMRAFTEDEDRINKENKKTFNHKYKYFRSVLEEIQSDQHPNLQYFIYKNIILRNLYGVDIMKEAVEIAKLRLFLKLVATVSADYRKPNLGLEPLPDIDFNIRSGNTLVGFATEAELKKGLAYTLDGVMAQPVIEEKCEVVSNAFSRYKEIQLAQSVIGSETKQSSEFGYAAFKKAKEDLNKRLKELNYELNLLLHKQAEGVKYEKWIESHQPFHWFAEYYEIVQGNGGFDVVIGNPPYVELKKIDYKLKKFRNGYSNLYTYCIERSCQLLSSEGCISMIVPTSLIGLDETNEIRKILFSNWKYNVFSTYAIRPAKLFDGVDQRLCIFISNNLEFQKKIISSKFNHWYGNERENLFEKLSFAKCNESKLLNRIEQVGNSILKSILEKLYSKKAKKISSLIRPKGKHLLYYHRSPRYWIRAIDFEPYFKSDKREQSIFHTKVIEFDKKNDLILSGSILNSNLFFLWFISLGNGRNITGSDVYEFPVGEVSDDTINKLLELFSKLMKDYKANSITRIRQDCEFQEFKINLSKHIIDKIDTALAAHYDFTAEELDFIINYDIKYRMGKELENDE